VPATVAHLQVELGSVESGLADRVDQGKVIVRQNCACSPAQCGLTRSPLLFGAEPRGAVVAQRESHVVDRQLQDALSTDGAAQRSDDLVDNLIRTAEHVSVVEVDLPHPLQAGQHTRSFRAEHRCQLVESYRQLPIRMLPRCIQQCVMGAVGRPQHDLVPAQIHGREHVIGEFVPVSRALEQCPLAEHRGVGVQAAVLTRDLLGQPLQLVADGGPGW
jgi:hypothetical protein